MKRDNCGMAAVSIIFSGYEPTEHELKYMPDVMPEKCK